MSSFDPSSPSPSKSPSPPRGVGRVRRRRARHRRRLGVGLRSERPAPNDATAISPALAKGAPTVAALPAGEHRHRGADLPFDWEGRWGSLSADHLMATVDLTTRREVHRQDVQRRAAARQHVRPHRVRLAAARARDHRRGRRRHPRRLLPPPTSTAPNDQLILDSDDEDSGVYWNAPRRQRQVLHRRRLDYRRRRRRHVHPRGAGRAPERPGRSSSPRSSAPPSR